MPFKSEKQRRFLWMSHPEIASKWSHKYGSKPEGKKPMVEKNFPKPVGISDIIAAKMRRKNPRQPGKVPPPFGIQRQRTPESDEKRILGPRKDKNAERPLGPRKVGNKKVSFGGSSQGKK